MDKIDEHNNRVLCLARELFKRQKVGEGFIGEEETRKADQVEVVRCFQRADVFEAHVSRYWMLPDEEETEDEEAEEADD